MSGYEKISSDFPPRLEDFPRIEDTEAVTAEVNRLFTPYVFFENHKNSIEISCSCCRQHGFIDRPPRTVTTVEYELLYNKHNEHVTCPYCGVRAIYKNARKLGKRTNLPEYKPVLMLSERDGDLYARAYWTRKTYKGDLLEEPTFYLIGAYHFTPGTATYYHESRYAGKFEPFSVSGRLNTASSPISEPFTKGSWHCFTYCSYAVLGLDAIGRSAFKYCEYDEFEKGIPAKWGSAEIRTRSDLMRFLTVASIYPRQTEMLMKTGCRRLVEDIVWCRKKNKAIFDWDKGTYLEAFGLDKVEMRHWRESGAGLETIAWYKKLRRAGVPEIFATLNTLRSPADDTDEFIRWCCKIKVKPSKLAAYIEAQHVSSDAFDPDLPLRTHETWQCFKDYIEMARMLGWDLKNTTVLLPKDLHRKHDEAAVEVNQKVMNEASAIVNIEVRKRSFKYNFELGDYFIRCALSAEEIVQEGKTLEHCVGGYAQRHMSGNVTILFLRRKDAPYKSLYTVEMDGNRLRQIHGYRNDFAGPAPRDTMAWFLTPWLDWVSKGSKRDKEGRPKLSKTKGAKTA